MTSLRKLNANEVAGKVLVRNMEEEDMLSQPQRSWNVVKRMINYLSGSNKRLCLLTFVHQQSNATYILTLTEQNKHSPTFHESSANID